MCGRCKAGVESCTLREGRMFGHACGARRKGANTGLLHAFLSTGSGVCHGRSPHDPLEWADFKGGGGGASIPPSG